MWNWEKKWECVQVFEGHTNFVWQIVINPRDTNQFASASLDRSIKVWSLGSSTPSFTLKGHEKGLKFIIFLEFYFKNRYCNTYKLLYFIFEFILLLFKSSTSLSLIKICIPFYYHSAL